MITQTACSGFCRCAGLQQGQAWGIMTEPTPAEGKTTTNKKSFASKNLNTTLQAVASKAEAPSEGPSIVQLALLATEERWG